MVPAPERCGAHGYEASGFMGIGAPKGTPAEIVDRLNSEVNAALADSRMKARFGELGLLTLSGSSAESGKFVSAEVEKWRKVIALAGIKSD